MIVLWGPGGDLMLTAVRAALAGEGTPHLSADPGTDVELDVSFDDRGLTGHLRAGAARVPLGDVSAVYVRPYGALDLLRARDPSPPDDALERAAGLDDACDAWLELTAALVVNRPCAAYGVTAKPLQSRTLEAAGFEVPDTLVTNDPAAAAAFADAYPAVIFKSLSVVRSIVARLDAASRDRLPAITSAPVQFQELVEGTDFRVHVVGDRSFACEIATAAVDYRYPDGDPPVLTPCPLPDDVAARCVRLTAELGLTLAGIDLRRTPDGRWYCFEANTCPAFSYYDRTADAPIATALADLLVTAEPEHAELAA